MLKTFSDYNYVGPSMMPLFRPGDGLIIDQSVGFDQLRCGDVISFSDPKKTKKIVHRVVKITEKGLLTRGDNNSKTDGWYVTPEMDPVLVTAVHRRNRFYRVYRGRTGMFVHYKNFLIRLLKRGLYGKLGKLAVMIANTGLFYKFKLFDGRLEKRCYKTEHGVKEFLSVGKQRIGHREADGKWRIRTRWRLFVDPDSIAGIKQGPN